MQFLLFFPIFSQVYKASLYTAALLPQKLYG